jgi:predicted nucleic acid-binding protein
VIAVDTNILVYAHRRDILFQKAAARRIAELADSRALWAIPWPCLHEFLAIATNSRVFKPPTPIASALEQVDAWLQSPSLVLLTEAEQHWSELRALLAAGQATGARVHDARLLPCAANTAYANYGRRIAISAAFRICGWSTRWLIEATDRLAFRGEGTLQARPAMRTADKRTR